MTCEGGRHPRKSQTRRPEAGESAICMMRHTSGRRIPHGGQQRINRGTVGSAARHNLGPIRSTCRPRRYVSTTLHHPLVAPQVLAGNGGSIPSEWRCTQRQMVTCSTWEVALGHHLLQVPEAQPEHRSYERTNRKMISASKCRRFEQCSRLPPITATYQTGCSEFLTLLFKGPSGRTLTQTYNSYKDAASRFNPRWRAITSR
jgi:hypothetical protein